MYMKVWIFHLSIVHEVIRPDALVFRYGVVGASVPVNEVEHVVDGLGDEVDVSNIVR